MSRKLLATLVIALAVVLGASGTTSALSIFGFSFPSVNSSSTRSASTSTATATSTEQACLHYANHVYEVCTAYIANASLGALLPYYEFARSSNPLLADLATHHLGSRYTGQAHNLITNRVAAWPAGEADVSLPDIRILSVHSNLKTNTATLYTEESWKVMTESGRVLFEETNARFRITMHRVPSYILHKWVVTNIS